MMEDWKQRTGLLLGEEKLEKLSNASVLIAGLGGVGGMATEMLCRAGIGHFTLIDGDVISSTNINRQLIALQTTVGKLKTEVWQERLLSINPELKITLKSEWLDAENTLEILSEKKYDFVLDAIDTLSPKVFLIKTCLELQIPLISSMGSGGKTDPSKIKIADISKTEYCRLAKSVRQRLAKHGIKKGVPVVFSTEEVDKSAVIKLENELYKKSTTGTISYLPAIFGSYMASYAINYLIKENNKNDKH